jgi:hypothetical protein
MKTLRNTLFVDLTDSIVGKMAVMTTIAIEERADLKGVLVLFYHSSFEALVCKQKGVRIVAMHKEKHKQDAGMIRHPGDATQWQNIDSRNLKFVKDLRNIRIVMSTDGMNPLMNNNTHSTWLIVLMILNLPHWLCNKRKYIMMSGLIPGPHQPGNDINTYFRPLVQDLKVLWNNNGVEV